MVFGCESSLSWKEVDDMVRRDFPDVQHVSVEELNRMLASGAAPVLFDVRDEAEYNVSHLPGAQRVQPGSDAAALTDTLEPDTPIIAYCSVGYRSSELVQRLTELGFTNVKNLDRALFAWANRGFAVERDGEEVREVHPFDDKWGTLLHEDLRAYEPGGK
jgi:rhodanese-related sulfurtransferase